MSIYETKLVELARRWRIADRAHSHARLQAEAARGQATRLGKESTDAWNELAELVAAGPPDEVLP